MSQYENYLVRTPLYEQGHGSPDPHSPYMTYMSRAQVPEADYNVQYRWIRDIPTSNYPALEHVANTEQLLVFIGGDPQHPEDLGGEIELFLGGQPFTIDTTAAVYIPPGLRHGPVTRKAVRNPYIEMIMILGKGDATTGQSANRDADVEKYIVRTPIYERAAGIKNRQSPAMTYMSSAQVPEAKYYMELGWIYGIPEPNPYVMEHVHATDEIVMHLGGNPEHPEDLGAEIEIMVEGEPLIFDTSTALFAPRGVTHCPLTWRQFQRPHIEMGITLGAGTR